ncbi:SLC45 family MFS transporter [Pseudothermotoga thermarum]|nr:SLC45 family MFS transporter [Pseudothermotoga thermarum]
MERFSYSKIFLLGFGFFGISVLWPLYNAYVPIFLKDFALSSFVIGAIMTIDNIFAIFMLPYIGTLSDQTRTKLGRRKPYILGGAPIAAIFFMLIPMARSIGSLPLMMLVIIIMNFAMALFRSPVIALMPDITPSRFRSQANGIINFMGGLGALLAYFAGKPLYDANYAYPFFVGALMMLGANILIVFFIKEPEEYTVKSKVNLSVFETVKKGNQELLSNLKDTFKSKERSLLFMLLSILFWFIGFNALETFFTSYAKFYLGISESTGALVLGVFSLTFMLAAIPAGLVGSKLGRKRTILLGLSVLITCLLIVVVVAGLSAGKNVLTQLFVLFAISGAGWALVNVNSLPMVVDMTTQEKVGGYTGLYYFFSMAANIFAPPLAGVFIDTAGYASLIPFSIGFVILSAITMSFVKKGEAVK